MAAGEENRASDVPTQPPDVPEERERDDSRLPDNADAVKREVVDRGRGDEVADAVQDRFPGRVSS